MTNAPCSPNTQAALLLTAPLLLSGRDDNDGPAPLSPGEYKLVVRVMRVHGLELADLFSRPGDAWTQCTAIAGADRLHALLERGFLLSQAVERWQTRAIWVAGHDESAYPPRYRERLGENAPPIVYGCGDSDILDTGGLAVVGSRHVDDGLVAYTEAVGRLAAQSGQTLVSGGARGIDQAAMRGALEEGGKVAGVMADSLERAVMKREHRDLLMDGRLALVSPYDPLAGFHVGHAMQRNKLIYALADAALVVSADRGKGGTWTGAVEQLEKLRFVPVYIRSDADDAGLAALGKKGARPWPKPESPGALAELLHEPVDAGTAHAPPVQQSLFE